MAAAASSSHQQGPLVRFESQRNTIKTMVSPKLYDAFISHRGPDVKHTLAVLLYNYIQDGKCRAFLDSRELEAGDSIPSTIIDAICSSSVQIAIFTKGYADSVWCLEELVLMLKQTKSLFIPVFNGVQPWELRYIEKGVYADAFTKLENRYPPFLIHQWKRTLDSASNISGYDFNNFNRNHEEMCKELVTEEGIVTGGDNPIKGICHCTKKFCKDIATAVVKQIEKRNPLPVAENPVGLNVLLQDFLNQVFENREEKPNIIGIFGMGGIGKTTLSIEFFNKRRSDYSAACFLFDVREAFTKGEVPSLQRKLLKDLFRDGPEFQNRDEGYSHLRSRLASCQRDSTFLIVIDDIDNEKQLNHLFPRDELTCGSLVLVTTRDERVLKRAKISCQYKLKEMDLDNSTELFCQHAFGTSGPDIGYEDLVKIFVEACGGLPLSLQVLGSHVSGGEKEYWKMELKKVRNTLPVEIRQVLKISIDALDNEQKQIFMDIACFFISKDKDMALTIWKGSGWIDAEHALETLKDRCLVTVEEQEDWFYEDKYVDYVLGMHDHVRDLGREMADEQISPSRLWHPYKHLKSLEAKNFQNILDETSGQTLRYLHAIDMDESVYQTSAVDIRFFLGNANDCAETKTSLLWLSIEMRYSMKQTAIIPSRIPVQNLQSLSIYGGRFQKLWQIDWMAPLHLKQLRLHSCSFQEFTCSSLQMLCHLEELELQGDWSDRGKAFRIEGRSFSNSLRKLTKLRSLDLRDLTLNGELALHKSRDVESPMVNLHKIKFFEVKLLEKVSVSAEHCPNLQSLYLHKLAELVELNLSPSCYELRPCKNLKTNPKLLDRAKVGCSEEEKFLCLESIEIRECFNLNDIAGIENLERLNLLKIEAGNGGIRNFIHSLQRVPSDGMTVIGKAVDGAESRLNANLFSDLIGLDAVFIKLDLDEVFESDNQLPLRAVLLCAVVHVTFDENFDEKWIVTRVVPDGIEIASEFECLNMIYEEVFGLDIKTKGCILAVSKKEEWKAVDILKIIFDRLHQAIE